MSESIVKKLDKIIKCFKSIEQVQFYPIMHSAEKKRIKTF